jgi:hypothetical protein
MQDSHILSAFLKFAALTPMGATNPPPPTSNLVQPPLLTGQLPKRESALISAQSASPSSGNRTSIKPATNTSKPLKA